MAHELISRPAAALLLGLIAIYRHTLSPAFTALGVHCRHAPTCSLYAADAVRRHGAWAGSWMALARVLRCRPLGSSGVDPAPERLRPGARWWAPWRYGDWRGPRRNDDGAGGRGPDAPGRTEDAEAHLS